MTQFEERKQKNKIQFSQIFFIVAGTKDARRVVTLPYLANRFFHLHFKLIPPPSIFDVPTVETPMSSLFTKLSFSGIIEYFLTTENHVTLCRQLNLHYDRNDALVL